MRVLLSFHPEIIWQNWGLVWEHRQELLRGVHIFKVQAHVLEGKLHLLGFVLPEHAVVHEDAGELFADGLVHEHGGNRGVHAA